MPHYKGDQTVMYWEDELESGKDVAIVHTRDNETDHLTVKELTRSDIITLHHAAYDGIAV